MVSLGERAESELKVDRVVEARSDRDLFHSVKRPSLKLKVGKFRLTVP